MVTFVGVRLEPSTINEKFTDDAVVEEICSENDSSTCVP